MRDDDRLSEGERRLNLVLRPGDESVARVIAGALHASQQRPRRHVGVIAAAMLALAVAGTLLWRDTTAPSSAPLVISGAGSIVVVTSEDGRRWLIQTQQSSPARGEYVIAFP